MSKLNVAKHIPHSNFNKLEQILVVFEMNLVDFVLFGEDKNISINNSENYSTNHFSVILADKNTSFELEKLNLNLIIAHQNEMITPLKQENSMLKDVISLLKR